MMKLLTVSTSLSRQNLNKLHKGKVYILTSQNIHIIITSQQHCYVICNLPINILLALSINKNKNKIY